MSAWFAGSGFSACKQHGNHSHPSQYQPSNDFISHAVTATWAISSMLTQQAVTAYITLRLHLASVSEQYPLSLCGPYFPGEAHTSAFSEPGWAPYTCISGTVRPASSARRQPSHCPAASWRSLHPPVVQRKCTSWHQRGTSQIRPVAYPTVKQHDITVKDHTERSQFGVKLLSLILIT